jgi:hypothetical protein
MNPTDIANALLFGIPFVTYGGLQHGLDSLKAYTNSRPREDEIHRASGGRNAPTATQLGSPSLRIAVATSLQQIEAAQELVRRRYAWRGYEFEPDDPLDPPLQRTPNDVTFVVESVEALIGTVTLGLDGPDGLLAERTHEGVIALARANGCRVCEVTRLAVAEGADSRTVLALLLSLGHLVARKVHKVTDVFIEVNPRHVAFYSRALGFVIAAGERICERVRAPSVLMHSDLDVLEQRLALMGTKRTMRPLLAQAA